MPFTGRTATVLCGIARGNTGQCRVDPPQARGCATVPPQLLCMSVEAEQRGRPFLQRYALSEQDCAAAGGGFPIFIGYSDFGVDFTSPVPRHRRRTPDDP